MSQLGDSLGALARAIGLLLRLPTLVLLVWSTAVLAVLAVEVLVLTTGTTGPGVVGTVLLVALLALLALPVVTLALRRRWLRLTQDAGASGRVVVGMSPTREVMTLDELGDRVEDEMRGREGEHEVRTVMDAFTESRLPPPTQRGAGARLTRTFAFGRLAVVGRVLGSMERAQRGLLTAAGGPTRAPYLVDDIRISVLALLGSLVTIVVGGLGAVVLAAVLLSR